MNHIRSLIGRWPGGVRSGKQVAQWCDRRPLTIECLEQRCLFHIAPFVEPERLSESSPTTHQADEVAREETVLNNSTFDAGLDDQAVVAEMDSQCATVEPRAEGERTEVASICGANQVDTVFAGVYAWDRHGVTAMASGNLRLQSRGELVAESTLTMNDVINLTIGQQSGVAIGQDSDYWTPSDLNHEHLGKSQSEALLPTRLDESNEKTVVLGGGNRDPDAVVLNKTVLNNPRLDVSPTPAYFQPRSNASELQWTLRTEISRKAPEASRLSVASNQQLNSGVSSSKPAMFDVKGAEPSRSTWMTRIDESRARTAEASTLRGQPAISDSRILSRRQRPRVALLASVESRGMQLASQPSTVDDSGNSPAAAEHIQISMFAGERLAEVSEEAIASLGLDDEAAIAANGGREWGNVMALLATVSVGQDRKSVV